MRTSCGLAKMFSMNVRGNDAQRNLAVDAAESQVVDLISEGRDIGPLGRVHIDRQDVLSIEIDVGREVKRKGVYPPLYSPRRTPLIHTVEAVITPSKSTKTCLPRASGRQLEAAPVERDELVGLSSKLCQGTDVGVRNHHAVKAGVVELSLPAVYPSAVPPVAVQRQDKPSLLGTCRLGARCSSSRIAHSARRQCSTRKQSSALHQKVASIHLLLTPRWVSPALLVPE